MEAPKLRQMDYTKPLFIRLENHIKDRLLAQCNRLGISQAAATKQSLVRWLEEEEAIQYRVMRRN